MQWLEPETRFDSRHSAWKVSSSQPVNGPSWELSREWRNFSLAAVKPIFAVKDDKRNRIYSVGIIPRIRASAINSGR